MRKRLFVLGVALVAVLISSFQPVWKLDAADLMVAVPEREDEAVWEQFEADLETVRQALKIPGMSAAVVQDQELVWAQGFGYADVENQVLASPDTPYGLASVTKPVAAVLIMQLVEEGLVDLDAPISDYGVTLSAEGEITVRHLLTHTSEGVPGTVFDYNGNRYARLGGVMEGASGRTFVQLLGERMLAPLDMDNTALNPINNWGGPSLKGLQDFTIIMGWGVGLEHYPDVYLRLAHPYQFDEAYEIVAGMYHLHHNPGAGLVSSVTDLAKFDIALDQGLLLGDAAKEEMWTPAYSTYEGRQDLQYGLGWYVQDLDGLRLLWHTGRWAPSTSALFLKVPEQNLTFIVLANTDNLTVPFYGIGNGDVSQSTLMLTFYRHFIFPRLYGYSPPGVDWQAARGTLVEQLSAVQDEASQVFLERELWSYRQAYASAGRTDLATKLGWVRYRVFPQSEFRNDIFFTATAGHYPVIPPVASAASLVWVARGIALWFMLVLVAVLWMSIRIFRDRETSLWQKGLWVLATLIMGPISLLAHLLIGRKLDSAPLPRWKQAVGASLFCISGYVVAWTLAIAVLMRSSDEPHPLLLLGLCYLTPLSLGLLLVRVPLLVQLGSAGFARVFARGFLAEVITLNLGFAVLFPLTMFANQFLFFTMPHPSNPYFWGLMSFISIVGALVLFPLHYWMARRNWVVLPVRTPAGEPTFAIPTMRNTWGTLLATLGIMVATLVFTVSQLG